MTCVGETKNNGASRCVPALSLTLTTVPASEVGKGNEVAVSKRVARLDPKAATMASLASVVPLKLAAETFASASVVPPNDPLNRTLSEPLAVSLLAIESVPVKFPGAFGTKLTAMVSSPPGATTNEVELAMGANRALSLATPVTLKMAAPVLRMVSSRLALEPGARSPKSSAAGASIVGRLAPLVDTLARIIALAEVVPGGGPTGKNDAPPVSDRNERLAG